MAVRTRPNRNQPNGSSNDVDKGITIEPSRKMRYAPMNVRRRPMTSLNRPASGMTATNAIR